MILFDNVVSTLATQIISISNFTKELLDGTLEAFIKTQAVPVVNDGPVKVVVGDNFHQLVTDTERDVFIKFYSPFCEHCQRIELIWDELANKLKGEDVDIVKIDASIHDWPESVYEVSAVPTFYWKFADKTKKPVRYSGSLTLDGFIKYVAKQASEELKGWDRNGRPKKHKL